MTLQVRRVTLDDCEATFACANDPTTRRMSFRTDPIAWDEHVAWFAARSADQANPYYVVTEEDGVRVAFARYDPVEAGAALVSFVVVPELRGRGLATDALALATSCAASDAGFDVVHAEIKAENLVSLRTFARAGYSEAVDAERNGEPFMCMCWRAPRR